MFGKRFVLLGCLLSAYLLLLGQTALAETILSGKVLATVMRAEPMPFNAVVDEVYVKPGDAVKLGMPLLRFHLQSEAERMLQKEVTLGSNTEELRGKILELEREKGRMEAQYNKNRQLVATGLGSQQALRRLGSEVSALSERIVLMRKTIQKGQDTFTRRLKELEKYYEVPLQEGMLLPEKSLILPSPLKGYVLSVASIFPGSLLAAGDSPVVVGSLDPMMIQVPVYEGEIAGIHEGAKAQVEIPSLGGKKFVAKVSEISWVSNTMNVEQPSYFTVKMMVANPTLELKPGFKAVVRF